MNAVMIVYISICFHYILLNSQTKEILPWNILQSSLNTGFDVLTAVEVKNSVFYDMTPHIPVKHNGHFGGKCDLQLQGQIVS
jgi:hypothetical protein